MANTDTVDPAIEAASEERRAVVAPEPEGSDEVERAATPFAARVQAILIGVMFVGFALIAQRWNKSLYQVGLPVLVLAAFSQIAFGNIPPTAGMGRSLKLLGITWVIVIAVFALGIVLAPYLIDL